jgi:mannitol 2-dehydrogenase
VKQSQRLLRPGLLGGQVMTTAFPHAVPLRRANLETLPTSVSKPRYDATQLTPAVVHLGVGAFHRAHQAVYLDRLAEAGERGWGLVGSGVRSGRLASSLIPQDGLYTVIERGAGAQRPRVVGIMQRYLGCTSRSHDLLEALADARTRLVTMTVTAPAYDEPAHAQWLGTAFDYLVEALSMRRRRGLGGLTVLSCDNLPDNGSAARKVVLELAELRDPRLAAWIGRHVSFPTSMVDRITPVTDLALRQELRRGHGIHDRSPVATEPFSQWVIEDEFATGRPPLEDVGAQFVVDARPYLAAKTSLLNASHCAIGFLGHRRGHRTSSEAMDDPLIRGLVTELMAEEVAPLLDEVPGLDLASYQRTLLRRFDNEEMADPVQRLCGRGSIRLANYVLPAVKCAVAQGRSHGRLALVVAAWIDHLRRHVGPLADLHDPRADVLCVRARQGGDDPRPVLSTTPGFEKLLDSQTFLASVAQSLHDLRHRDIATVLASTPRSHQGSDLGPAALEGGRLHALPT